MSDSPAVMILKELLDVEKEVETHISHVLLTKDHVYKIKKKVDFGFLDFSRLKQRKQYCLMEKELNERFCDGVYEDVLKIARKEKSFELAPFDNTQNTVEYVVKMRRIPEGDFFSTRVQNNEISYEEAVRVGKHIGSLFKGINTPEMQAKEEGDYSVVRFNCEENFQQTEGYKDKFIDPEAFDFIKKKTMAFLDENADLFRERAEKGFVKNGHGDLRIEHVFYNGDQIGLIDCIEFNRRFRFNDVMSEIGFLSTELDQAGRTDLSDGVLEGFFTEYDDEGSRKLLNFYRCYRAYVRAKVTCFLLAEKGEEWENFNDVLAQVHELIRLAVVYAVNMDSPKTLVFHGLMASGKSKNARLFKEIYPVHAVNSDHLRKTLAGMDPEERVYVDYGTEIYTKEHTQRMYEEMGRIAQKCRELGRMCILDGSFSKKAYLEYVLSAGELDYSLIRFSAPEDVVQERLRKRLEKKTVSDGREEIYQAQKDSAEDIGSDLDIVTTGDPRDNATAVIKFLVSDEA
ncbi:AAA family ATPase [Limisalsivibrio acetivorans]|uniref:bifunctional aminoglycoside phosphotransferase/ATP-binding protein n=1 Tax=Limisalsivibrio acetivorans TaxID=1304888 RepID=UPI0003B47775|nr:AAA family ATPase [Limisalsivibrio acetivorans]